MIGERYFAGFRNSRPANAIQECLSDTAKDFITRLTLHDPTKRLGFNGEHEIFEHPFFEGIDWDKLRRKEYVLNDKPEKTKAEILAALEFTNECLDEEKTFEVYYGHTDGEYYKSWEFT